MITSLLMLILAGLGQTAELRCISPGCGATAASGNITIEVKNIDRVRKELQQLVKASTAVSKNYSEYANSRGKRSLNAAYELTKPSAQGFMDGIAQMGTVTSRNYSDQNNPGYDLESLQRKLDSYQRHLERLLAAPGADPDIVALMTQQIQSLESQLESYKRSCASSGAMATINVQICEKGYNQSGPFPVSPFKLIALAALVLIGIGVLVGLLLSRLAGRKGKAGPAAETVATEGLPKLD